MEIFTLLETIEDLLENSKKVPFSNKSIVDKDEILDVKWISKEELINMTDKELRDEKRIKITLQMLEENKAYPLDTIKILEYINSWKGLK